MNPGDTIFSIHLWVICSEPQSNGAVVAFNLTTKNWDSDLTCVVQPEDHDYVRHPSVVAYEHGELFTPTHIKRLQKLAPQTYGPVSSELLHRIQEGALNSEHTPEHLKKVIRATLGLS